jgi:hypothetical protein
MKPRRALLLLLLAGCHPVPAADVVTSAQDEVAAVVAPAVVAVREIVDPILPPLSPLSPPLAIDECPQAIELIVEFEVVSRAYYEQRLQGVICPPAASGPTWGIGYDAGHQTARRISQDWTAHPHVDRLALAAGVTGQAACRPLVAQHLADVRTPLAMAEPVFITATLPEYASRAARAFRDGWDRLPACARGGLTSVVYNRGAGMTGESRREMRVIRDECVPAGDLLCIANQVRAMTRLWVGTNIEAGMRRRRHAEAALVLTSQEDMP